MAKKHTNEKSTIVHCLYEEAHNYLSMSRFQITRVEG